MSVSPDEVPLVSEASVALRTLVGLLLGRRRDIGGVVVEVLVPLEKLLLPEALITLITLERLLVRVDQHVALQVALGDRAVGTEVTLEALLSLMGLFVHFQGVPEINYPIYILLKTLFYCNVTCPGSFCHTSCNASASRWCEASGRGASGLFSSRKLSGKARIDKWVYPPCGWFCAPSGCCFA